MMKVGLVMAWLLSIVPLSVAAEAKFINGAVYPEGLPFSEVVVAGHTIYMAGQIGVKPGTLQLVAGGIEAESRQVMDNIKRALEHAGFGMENLVKCTAMLEDIGEWSTFNRVYQGYFDKRFPARSALGADGLALGARVEVECVGYLP